MILSTAPDGAIVFVDGTSIGNAPISKGSLVPGDHLVQVAWPDGTHLSRIERVQPGSSRLVKFARPEAGDRPAGIRTTPTNDAGLSEGTGPGYLVFATIPVSGIISIDGEKIGKAPTAKSDLLPGEHLLNVTWPDGDRLSKTVAVVAGVSRVILLNGPRMEAEEAERVRAANALKVAKARELAKKFPPGKLGIMTIPAGAAILLDGESVGTSPLILQSVFSGEHTITAVWPDGKRGEITETVESDKTKTVRLFPSGH